VNRLLPDLDRTAAGTLVAQITAFYREAIELGRLRAGERLPTIRAVAAAAGVTRTTVQEAYRQLGEHGFVAGTVGRGTEVLDRAGPRDHAPPVSAYAAAALRQTAAMPGALPLQPGQALVANFAELSPDGELFPVAELRSAIDRVLQRRGGELLGYAHAATGLPELRAQLAQRRCAVDPPAAADDILITSGGQQALDLVLRTFCTPGDAVVVTSPSYHQLHGLLKALGLRAIAVPVGDQGLDLTALAQALAAGPVRLLYLMPTFHNPTGRTLDLRQRQALLQVVGRTRVPILEDEYQQPLRFRGDTLPSLRGLDRRGLTVTAHTFSKVLFPGLRLGWVQAGPSLLRPMAAVKRFMDLEASPLLQAALVEFIDRGALDRYLKKLRAELHKRHALLQKLLRAQLPAGCTVTDPDGGFLCWLELPAAGQGEALAELALARGVRVVPGRAFDPQGRPSRGVRLSLSRSNRAQIEAGAAVLAACAHRLLQADSSAPSRSFV